MPKYEVIRNYECSDVYVVIADNEEDAIQKAVNGEYEGHKSYDADEDTSREVRLIEE